MREVAGTIKGMTIEIGGNTAPLEQALKSTNKEINATQKELKEVNKLLKLDPENITLLKQKQEILTEAIGKTTTKLDALKQAQRQLDEQMKNGGEVNSAEYRKLEREIAITEGSLAKLKNEAKATGDQMNKSSIDVEKLANATKKAGEVALSATQALVNFTVQGVKVMTGAVLSASAAIVKLAKDAGTLADDLNTLASKTGLSTEQLQQFQYASELIDVDVDTLASSLKKLTSSMSTASKGSGDAYETFKSLGVEFKNADGTLRDSSEVFNETIKALGNMANETERDATAMKLFGKSATELNPLIEGGVDTLEEMGQRAKDLGLILSQDTLDGANKFNDALDKIKANGQGLFNVIGGEIASSFAPELENVNTYFEDIIQKLTGALEEGGFEGFIDELSVTLSDVITKAIEKLPDIAKGVMTLIKKIVSAIKDNASQMGEGAAELYTVLVEGFYEVLPDIVDIAIKMVSAFVSTMGDNLDTIIPVVIQGMTDILQAVIDNLDIIIEAGLSLINGIITGLMNAMPTLLEKAPILVEQFLDTTMEQLPVIWQTIYALFLQVVEFMLKPENLQLFINTAVTLISVIANALIENIPLLIQAGITIAKNVLQGLMGTVKNLGINIIKGLWEGMNSMRDWVMQKIKSLCMSMLDTIKSFFGIESPSKVMANEVGTYMAEGIGVGFGNTMPSVIKAMQEKLQGVTGSLQTELTFGNIPQIEGNKIISENQYITKNYTNTVETIRQPQAIDLILDGTKVARAIIPPLNNEYNRLGVKI